MKILLLTSHLDMGGIAVYTISLARHLKRTGHEAVVVSGGGKLESWLADCGITHVKMNIRTKSEFGLKVWKALPGLKRFVEEHKFDIIHSQTRSTHVLGALLGRMTGLPHVTTCHGFFNHRRLARRLFPCWGKASIAISDSVSRHLINDFGMPEERVHRVYNGIDLARHTASSALRDTGLFRRLGLREGVIVIGTICRLSPVKGCKFLIEAFRGLVSRGYDAQLLIVGEGPEEENLKKQASATGCGDRIFFDQGGEALERYLSLLDIYCIPSVDEGFGLSLVEAMASGRACVASNVGGLAEIISDAEDGILFESGNTKSLADSLELLVRDEPLRKRLASAARDKAFRRFSIEDSVAGTVKVYEKVASNKR